MLNRGACHGNAGGTGGPADSVFLPTGAMQFLDALMQARPRHMLIAADFDHLPDVAISGLNAPIVSQTVQNITCHDDFFYCVTIMPEFESVKNLERWMCCSHVQYSLLTILGIGKGRTVRTAGEGKGTGPAIIFAAFSSKAEGRGTMRHLLSHQLRVVGSPVQCCSSATSRPCRLSHHEERCVCKGFCGRARNGMRGRCVSTCCVTHQLWFCSHAYLLLTFGSAAQSRCKPGPDSMQS